MEQKSFDEKAFNALYETYADKVYNIALYHTGNHHAAEDITQSVFMTLYTKLGTVNQKRIKPWLNTTALFMAKTQKRDRFYETPIEMEDLEAAIDEVEYLDSVEDLLLEYSDDSIRKKLAREIYQALYEKNVRWYEAITMAYILEQPQKEVAENMKMSLGALQIMLHRAKNWLKKKYQYKLDHLDDE